MRDVCWIHNKKFKYGEFCQDCVKRDAEISTVCSNENVKSYNPGDKMWNVVKWMLLFTFLFWIAIIVGAIMGS